MKSVDIQPIEGLPRNAVGGRIRARRFERNMSQAALARAVGIKPPSLADIESGETKRVSAVVLMAIGKALDTDPNYFLTGKSEIDVSPTIAQARKGAVIRSSMLDAAPPNVPVVGTAQLGDDGYWLELDFPAGHGDGFITYPSRDPNAYAVRCRGDSMRPRIKPGEFVVIEPGRPYAPGDEVLVKDRRGRVMVKVFNFNRNGNIEVSSVNEDHKPITLEMTEIECVHYVAAICKPSMYYEALS